MVVKGRRSRGPVAQTFRILLLGRSSYPSLLFSPLAGSFTGFIWWGVWFQFFVLAFIIASLFINMSSYSQAIFTFLGMVTVVLMVSADQSRSAVDAFSGSLKSSAQATLAGTIFNIIMNFILILSLTGELDTLTSHITHNHTPRPGAEPVTGGSATMTTNPIAAESATV